MRAHIISSVIIATLALAPNPTERKPPNAPTQSASYNGDLVNWCVLNHRRKSDECKDLCSEQGAEVGEFKSACGLVGVCTCN